MNNLATAARVAKLLRETPMRRVRTGLGGSHTVVSYPPLDALRPSIRRPRIDRRLSTVNYYFHIAFCEWMCAFCHYSKAPHLEGRPNPKVDRYLRSLQTEALATASKHRKARIETIYVGGGTPTSLEPERLSRVMGLVREVAGAARPDICVEVSPITMAAPDAREKLAILAEAGVNRLSVGIQTFDRDLLPRLRGHGIETLVKAMDRLSSSGVPLNVDLIQDLPGQSDESIENDLRWIGRLGPQQVTWYILRFQAPSPMGRSYGRGSVAGLPDDQTSAMRRHRILEGMAQLGYQSEPGCRFRSDGVPDRYKALRGGVDANLIGFGASAYSHTKGWFWRNAGAHRLGTALDDYSERIEATGDATEECLELSSEEVNAGRACNAIRRFLHRSLEGHSKRERERLDVTLTNLVRAELIDEEQDGWTLSPLGRLFEEEIVSLFYSGAMRAALHAKGADWADDYWFNPQSTAEAIEAREPALA